MFWKTSKDSALWVRNDPAERLGGARVARAGASVAGGMLVVEVWWDTMLLINISCFRQLVDGAERARDETSSSIFLRFGSECKVSSAFLLEVGCTSR